MVPLILAVDPGEKRCGYAIVRAEGDKVRFLAAGEFDAGRVPFLAVVDACAHWGAKAGLLAVEQPAGFIHDPFRGPALLATAVAAGGMAWLAADRGIDVVCLAATEVRRALLGKTRLGAKSVKGDMDRMIAMVLPGVVVDHPKRTNVHVRDSLALAVAANWARLSAARRTP